MQKLTFIAARQKIQKSGGGTINFDVSQYFGLHGQSIGLGSFDPGLTILPIGGEALAIDDGATFVVEGDDDGGTLSITFTNSATTTQVNETLQAITYENLNANPPANVKIDYTMPGLVSLVQPNPDIMLHFFSMKFKVDAFF